MGMSSGFSRLHRFLSVLALTVLLSAILVADLAQAECGVLETTTDDLTIQPGQVVTSCNGEFALTYRDDNNVVLKHIPSDAIIWSQPADQGSAYAFYRPANPELGTVAVLPPSPDDSGLPNNAAVASTPGNSDPDTKLTMVSEPDKSDLNPTVVTSSDTSDPDADLATASSPDDSDAESTIELPVETVSDSDTDSDTTAASGSSIPKPNLEANTASVAAAASSGQDVNVAAASPTSSSKSDSAVALSSGNNLFLDPPSNSYFTKRIEIRKKDEVLPDKNGIRHWHPHLLVLPNGNLVLAGMGDDSEVKWSSNTGGSSCKSFFLSDKAREALIAKVDEREPGTDMSTLLRTSPCSLERVYVSLAGEKSMELPMSKEGSDSNVAGPGPDSGSGSGSDSGSGSGSGSDAQRRFVLPGRTVENSFKFYLTNNPVNPHRWIEIPIAEARLIKTWYFNGENVSSTVPGSNPDRAKLTGEVAWAAQYVGYFFSYQNPGSDVEEPANWHNSPLGAHLSSRVSRMNFEAVVVPLIPFPSIKTAWHHELWIKGYGDGHVECRGGHKCTELKGP